MSSKLTRFLAAVILTALAAGALTVAAPAQQATPATPPASAVPGEKAPAGPAANGPASAPEASKPDEPAEPKGEAPTVESVDVSARPFAFIEGKADRDEIYGAILGSLGQVKREMDKAGLKPSDHPLAVFVDSDETGFKYRAGYPLAVAPGGADLSDAVKFGETPAGKAMRFQHVGSYAEIDATYDLITAYLDEKSIAAQDTFVEEYVNDVKDADDPSLQVNIYVMLK